MAPQLKFRSANIVLRGAFNPAIIQPRWLASEGLLHSEEAKAAEIGIIHPEIAQFKTDWLKVTVRRDHFQALTENEAYYESLRDTVMGVFSLLRHTPLKALGINQELHYSLSSHKDLVDVADTLAPNKHWQDILVQPTMGALVMRGERTDGRRGHHLLRVEPSNMVTPGLLVAVNDHYDLPDPLENPMNAEQAIGILTERWQPSLDNGLEMAQKILSRGALK